MTSPRIKPTLGFLITQPPSPQCRSKGFRRREEGEGEEEGRRLWVLMVFGGRRPREKKGGFVRELRFSGRVRERSEREEMKGVSGWSFGYGERDDPRFLKVELGFC